MEQGVDLLDRLFNRILNAYFGHHLRIAHTSIALTLMSKHSTRPTG